MLSLLITLRRSLVGLGLLTSPLVAAECLPPPMPPSAEQLQILQNTAKDHGFLWKISKDGRTSWLYGSIHVNRLSSALPGPKVRAALQQSPLIALELDPSDATTLAKLAQFGALGARPVPAGLKSRLKVQLDKVCLPESIVATIHPALLFSTLSALSLREAGFEAAYGTEFILAGAKNANKKIVELETVESQMQVLLVPVTPEDYAEALSLLEIGTDRDITLRLLDAWLTSNLFTLETFSEWCNCLNTPKQRTDLRRLLDDRNPALAEGIANWHSRQATPIFAAVGSLHMIGKNGIPALLAKRGFKVERVIFDN